MKKGDLVRYILPTSHLNFDENLFLEPLDAYGDLVLKTIQNDVDKLALVLEHDKRTKLVKIVFVKSETVLEIQSADLELVSFL